MVWGSHRILWKVVTHRAALCLAVSLYSNHLAPIAVNNCTQVTNEAGIVLYHALVCCGMHHCQCSFLLYVYFIATLSAVHSNRSSSCNISATLLLQCFQPKVLCKPRHMQTEAFLSPCTLCLWSTVCHDHLDVQQVPWASLHSIQVLINLGLRRSVLVLQLDTTWPA